MIAPDVERLVELLKEVLRIVPDKAMFEQEEDPHPPSCLRHKIEQALAALSSRPDSIPGKTKRVHIGTVQINGKTGEVLPESPDLIPPQNDVAGRLAKVVEGLLREGLTIPMLREAHKTLLAYRANRSAWIPVGERLPEKRVRVIPCEADLQFVVGDCFYGHASNKQIGGEDWADEAWRYSRDEQKVPHPERITHWQPLPTPPQEGQKV